MKLEEVELPPLEAGQARIEVLRAPINPSDIAQIEGTYGFQPPLPAAAGMEGIGRVIEINGDQSLVGSLTLLPEIPGSWSTHQTAPLERIVPLPEADIDQLAMLAVNPATAYLLLTKYVDLQKGDWVIQSAGNSAVGRYVAQLANVMGFKVASVVRRESAAQNAEDAGSHAVFVDGDDLVQRIEEKLDAKPRLAIDAISGDMFQKLTQALAPEGTAVLYGAMSGSPAASDFDSIIFKDVSIRGFWLAKWFQTASQEEQAKVYGFLTEAIAKGELSAPIAEVFSLDRIGEALEFTLAGRRSGKVLVAPNAA
ncbi:MAG: zinc-dependent alcohol dehydrogenase family protein [Pseudomonadota bacterium]